MLLGIGTITSPAQLERARLLGAGFAVSRAARPPCVGAARKHQASPTYPGSRRWSEIMATLDDGFATMKFFPARGRRWHRALKSFAPLFDQAAFCPTGGVSEANLPDYLALSNVVAVGGSWLAPEALAQAGDWAAITALAARGMALARRGR